MKMGDVMFATEENEDQHTNEENDDDDNVTYPAMTFQRNKKQQLIGGGGLQKRSDVIGERELQKALPEMANTLGNWTLHGHNLGNMLNDYHKQYRYMKKSQRQELGHFFNMASNILDTIGSMTENTILRLVKFDNNNDMSLTGGSIGV